MNGVSNGMELWRQLGIFVLTAGGIGILAHLIGEALPRERFRWDRFPYAPCAWERDGRFYSRLKIESWKNKVPDKSRFVPSTVRKSVGLDRSAGHLWRLVQETCVAELVHWVLLVVSPVVLLVMKPPYSVIAAVLYGLSNLPFIMIQRYNRPRLVRAAQRAGRNKDARQTQEAE